MHLFKNMQNISAKITEHLSQRATDSGANFWVGLARGGNGSFAWVDGTPFDFEHWLDGEPNSSVSGEKNSMFDYVSLLP